MLHYNPRQVSSINMPIFRRTNCIITASGIVTLCTAPYKLGVAPWGAIRPVLRNPGLNVSFILYLSKSASSHIKPATDWSSSDSYCV